jgi:hypothetical protein
MKEDPLLTDVQLTFFKYKRIETSSPTIAAMNDLLPSLVNLHVAMWADAYIGTFSSNWCRLIFDLERTRGDGGGYEFISLDTYKIDIW